ncbi:DNA polymerase [Xanthomonas phage FoX4]|uniref:DNA polymerase n=1 Tax=Xanthomonas phage FoX4 TaxID=2723900 RepID=A0A858WHN4_9CAUD|nr:DNA polymerase [Xanthomonas phage FoX4]QJI52964.1 DNA polymerase [Xanthomonas phage FoX4]
MRIPNRTRAALDIESYKNYFLLGIKSFVSRKFVYFEMFKPRPGVPRTIDTFTPNKDRIKAILRTHTVITFNGMNYDMPILSLALSGADTEEIKAAGDKIIVGGIKPWQFRDLYECDTPGYVDHIDLIEMAPGVAISLKTYGGRMGSKRLQDLPIHEAAIITPADRKELIPYNGNDLDTTIDLAENRAPQILLRENMSKEYGIDMRSKSDAQVAEAVIKSEIEKIKGRKLYRPEIKPGTTFFYKPPAFIQFKTKQMQDILEVARTSPFMITGSDKLQEPKALSDLKVRMGRSVYSMGIGGLHSTESCVSYVSDEDYILLDRDVRAYYPQTILNCRLYPKQLGEDFLRVYSKIVARRVVAKKTGDKVTDEALKITINGSFGKFGSKWSVLYAPDLMIQTTLTGQLALLMLIETLEEEGISVVSGNTDGIVIRCPRDRIHDLAYIMLSWEFDTGYTTEETRYKALYSANVNNYIAIYEKPKQNKDGSLTYHKGKGVYADFGITKNPQNAICVEAAVQYLVHGTPVAATIDSCDDIRKFLTVRNCKGGAMKVQGYTPAPEHATKEELLAKTGWEMEMVGKLKRWAGPASDSYNFDDDGYLTLGEAYKRALANATRIDSSEYLGKVVRWYRSDVTNTPIVSVSSGAKVAGADNAMPLMELPDAFPDDVDFDFYTRETYEILRDIGAVL